MAENEQAQAVTPATRLNAFRSGATEYFKNNVALASEANINQIADRILGSQVLMNEYINSLMEKVAQSVYDVMDVKNPFTRVKKGSLGYGDSIEDIYFGLAKEHLFTGSEGVSDLLSRETLPTQVAYYRSKRESQYRVTISDTELRQGLTTSAGYTTMYNKILARLSQSAVRDEFLYTLKLINAAYSRGKVPRIAVGDVLDSDQEKAKSALRKLSTKIKSLQNTLSFPNTVNEARVESTTSGNLTLWLDPDVSASFETNFLSDVFNPAYAQINLKIEPLPVYFENSNIVGLLADDEFFQIYDILNTTMPMINPASVNVKLFHTVRQIMSTSRFATAVFLTKNEDEAKASIHADAQFVVARDRAEDGTYSADFNLTLENFDESKTITTTNTVDGDSAGLVSVNVTPDATKNGTYKVHVTYSADAMFGDSGVVTFKTSDTVSEDSVKVGIQLTARDQNAE